MKRLFKLLCSGQSGYSLIEVLAAIALLAILAVGLTMGLTTGIKALAMTDTQDTARDLAQAQMENIQTQPYDFENDPPVYSVSTDIQSAAGKDRLNIGLETSRLDRGDGTVNDTGIQHITVLITRDAEVIYSLDGQKVKW